VVVVYITDGTNSDSVVYGYAFRDHWMWYNGFLMNDGYYVSFIIWKDYNCIISSTIDSNSLASNLANSFDVTTQNAIYSGVAAYSVSASSNYLDIWSTAYGVIPYLINFDSTFQGDKAYTVIMSQSNNVRYYASFCAKSFYYNTQLNIGYPNTDHRWGKMILLQMR
jgi:hypothetical protein